MNSPEYLEYHNQFCAKMHEIAVAKNSDYSSFTESAFGNLEASEKLDVTSTEVGILVRILDKFSRINSFIKTGTLLVADEKIEDTCLDACNYFILLSAYITSKKQQDAR